MLRIAILNLTGGEMSGGYKKYLKNILPLLSLHNQVEAIFCASPEGLSLESWFEKMDNVTFVNCKPFSLFGIKDINLQDQLDQFKPDVIFIPIERYFKYRNVPTICMLQNMLPLVSIKQVNILEIIRNWMRKIVAHKAIKATDQIIAISGFVSNFLKQEWNIPAQKISIIYFGVSLPHDNELTIPSTVSPGWKGKYIFTAGSIESYRGLEDIIYAVNKLKSDGVDHKVIIAGSARPGMLSYYRELQLLVDRLDLRENICWAGLLNEKELGWCYKNAMVYVMSSRVEACPNTALEAMLYGDVIISTTMSPMPEFFIESALYYEAGDISKLANSILEVSRFSITQRENWSQKAKNRVLEFTWKNTINKTIIEIKSLIKNKSYGRKISISYTDSPLSFKSKKVLRYLKLYGFGRTFVKIKSQFHMKKKYIKFPELRTIKSEQKIILIGCGNFSYSNIAYYLNKNFGDIIAGCMDIDLHRAASLSKAYKVPIYTNNFEDLLKFNDIKLCYIASNHYKHAEYAIKCIESGINVYIEKPHVVNLSQLEILYKSMNKNKQVKVFLGFNRPTSMLGNIIKEHLLKEKGQTIYNWFVTGHEIDSNHWYFDKNEGGRILGNLCHWTDFLFQMQERKNIFPIQITPVKYEENDSNIAIILKFCDGSIATVSFSSLGHTFEGVREKLNIQKGDLIIGLDDFQKLRIDNIEKVKEYHLPFRDHGHEKNIINAYRNVFMKEEYDHDKQFFWIINTAWLFLNVQKALDEGTIINIDEFKMDQS